MRFRAVGQQPEHTCFGDASSAKLRGDSQFLNDNQIFRRSGHDPLVTGGTSGSRQSLLPWLVVNKSMGQCHARDRSGQVGNDKPASLLRQLFRACQEPTAESSPAQVLLERGGAV